MGKGTRQCEGDTRKCERDEVKYKGKGREKDDLRGVAEGILRRKRER